MIQASNIIAPFNNPLISFISARRFRWLRHTLFILIGLLLAFKGDFGVENDPRSPELLRAIIISDALTYLFIMGMIYALILFFIPRLLFRSKVFLFALAFAVILVLIFLVVWALNKYLVEPHTPGNVLQHIDFTFIVFVQLSAVSTVLLGSVVGLVIFKKWIKDVQRMNELQQTNLRAELEQLKSQVNPHFLFNTLNNLMVLMKTDPEKASQVLLGLSDLLRYQLYDSAKEKILLAKDIEFIRNLLALEKIRRNDFTYEINIEGSVNMVSLPPFLFIPFVENAIKHGASSMGHSYLTMEFRVTNHQLHYTIENSKPPVKNNSIGGIGLKNVVRRLELLYPGTHNLEIIDNKDKYIVNLIIPIL